MSRPAGSLMLALRVLNALVRARVLLTCVAPSRAIACTLAVRARRSRHRPDAALVIRLTHGVGRRLPWTPTCLERALAAGRVLGAAAVPGRVVVGVSPRPASLLDAHAWVEVRGLDAYPGPHEPLMAWAFPAHPQP